MGIILGKTIRLTASAYAANLHEPWIETKEDKHVLGYLT